VEKGGGVGVGKFGKVGKLIFI